MTCSFLVLGSEMVEVVAIPSLKGSFLLEDDKPFV